MKHISKKYQLVKSLQGRAVLVLACISLQACVSTTLESAKSDSAVISAQNDAATQRPVDLTGTNQTSTNELALTGQDNFRPQTREEGVAEIRRKAAEAPENKQAPDIGTPRNGATPLLSNEQANTRINELNTQTRAATAEIPDEELLANQRSMSELRKKAASHYDSAVKNIEKTE